MKKTFQVKRTITQTPKGVQIRYFQDGKRLKNATGRLKWIKQNYEKIDRPYAKEPVNLTADEIKTYKQRKAQADLFRYKGKAISKFMTEVLKARQLIPYDADERDILKLRGKDGSLLFRNYGQFEQAFETAKKNLLQTTFTSLMGVEGWRGRTQNESAISVLEGLQIVGYDNWKLEIITKDGDIIRGKEQGMIAIREFEENETDQRTKWQDNVAAVSFTYDIDWDFVNRILTIRLWDKFDPDAKGGGVLIQTRTSDPIKRTK